MAALAFAATLGWRTKSRWDSCNQRTDGSHRMTLETFFEKFDRFADARTVEGAVNGGVVAVNFRRPCPNGATSSSPGLAHRAYPGSTSQGRFNPTGVAAFGQRRTQP